MQLFTCPHSLSYLPDSSGGKKSEDVLAQLQSQLNDYTKKSNDFQDKMGADVTELRQYMTSLSTTLINLETMIMQSSTINSRDYTSVAMLQNDMNKQLDMNRQLMDKQDRLENTLHKMHSSLSHHIEEVHSEVNLLAGSWECGGTQGWRRVAFLDMTNATHTCPPGWRVREMSGKRVCGRSGFSSRMCNSTLISVHDVMYSKVCGRLVGYQYGGTTAFLSYHQKFVSSIDSAYVDGVSITHSVPRKHIWTFAAGGTEIDREWPTSCPCDATININLPKFVDQDYFCESGLNRAWEGKYEFYPDDPLWDGKGCTATSQCCQLHGSPYFVKTLPTPTRDDLEVRLCGYTVPSYGAVLIELMELYVQ